MILFAILTGAGIFTVWRRHLHWGWVLLFCSWGLLASGTHLGQQDLLPFLAWVSAHTSQFL